MTDIFATVKFSCTACGSATGTCECWVKCECGRHYLRTEKCPNEIWHVAREFAEEAADNVVADMAKSYKLFQRGPMAERLKRAVIRQTHPILVDTLKGVEDARRERESS